MENCHFLHLPRELRDKIYKNLISVKHTRTPKDFGDDCPSTNPTYYDWNIDPTILRVNKQTNVEAKEIMGLDNDFVVIERAAKKLERTNDDIPEENAIDMLYNELWPGKACEKVDVPGERMRICFAERGQSATGPAYVMLVKELRDFCVDLSIFPDVAGQYRVCGLKVHITIRQPLTSETPQARAERERSLLLPLAKLRSLKNVEIQGVEPAVETLYAAQMTRPRFDAQLVKSTIEELVSSGDSSTKIGLFDIGTAYYCHAHFYLQHFTKVNVREVFEHFADPLAFEFKILQRRAFNCIEDDAFPDAFELANLAIRTADQLFAIDAPTAGPPTDRRGRTTKGAMRQWKCNRIKDAAERNGQRIKCEDIGRCYYYKSIVEHLLGGDAVTEQADEDKYTAIGCCVVSDTVTEEENVVKELLELDMRTMKRLSHENIEDDEWEDEEEWVEEG